MPTDLLAVIPTVEAIETALLKRLYQSPTKIIQDDARANWAEELVGQLLGQPWRFARSDGRPWDLECGPPNAQFPERIRI